VESRRIDVDVDRIHPNISSLRANQLLTQSTGFLTARPSGGAKSRYSLVVLFLFSCTGNCGKYHLFTRHRWVQHDTDLPGPSGWNLSPKGDPHLSSEDFTWEQLQNRVTFPTRKFALELSVALSEQVPGDIIEFGVAEGGSTRILRGASRRSGKRVFACDSFEGLQEKFENAEVGTFACEPPKIPGVEIVEGYFEKSLTPELASRVGRVALASLDADLYSSTICALRWLTPLLGSGSLLLFDEFLGEHESEKRAFEDWKRETGVLTVLIAEFLRQPSGWGTKIDKRPLFQVIGDEPLPSLSEPAKTMQDRILASPGGRFARRVSKLIRGRR
jgi:Macrocin-O-methyltransferase (TylF)